MAGNLVTYSLVYITIENALLLQEGSMSMNGAPTPRRCSPFRWATPASPPARP